MKECILSGVEITTKLSKNKPLRIVTTEVVSTSYVYLQPLGAMFD